MIEKIIHLFELAGFTLTKKRDPTYLEFYDSEEENYLSFYLNNEVTEERAMREIIHRAYERGRSLGQCEKLTQIKNILEL